MEPISGIIGSLLALLVIILPPIIKYFLDKKAAELQAEKDRQEDLARQQKQDVDRETEISDLNRKIKDAEAASELEDKTR